MTTKLIAPDIEIQFARLFGGVESKMGIAVYRGFAQTFLDTVDPRIEQLWTFMKENDRRSAITLAHQLKASFKTIGSEQLSLTCIEIEDYFSNDAPFAAGEVEPLFHRLSAPVGALKREVQAFLNKLAEAEAGAS